MRIKINYDDFIMMRNFMIKRLTKLKEREKSLIFLLHDVPHPKNSYLRLFECREEIRKLEYLINKY